MKWNGVLGHLYRLNCARRTSWGWWDKWNDTAFQTQDSKFSEQGRNIIWNLNARAGDEPAISNFPSRQLNHCTRAPALLNIIFMQKTDLHEYSKYIINQVVTLFKNEVLNNCWGLRFWIMSLPDLLYIYYKLVINTQQECQDVTGRALTHITMIPRFEM